MVDAVMTENGSLSISAWIYPLTFGTAVVRVIVNRGSVRFTVRTVSGIGFSISGATALFYTGTNNTIVINTWQHVSVTWAGTTASSGVSIRVNAATISTSFAQAGSALTDNAVAPLTIGGLSSGAQVFPGYISEVAIWNTVLTSAQIFTLSRTGRRGLPLTVQTANLISYWPLEDVANGSSGDLITFRDAWGTNPGTGADGTNNTGLTGTIGEPLCYLAHIDKSRGMGRGMMQGGQF